jgi:hypothetical protein
MAISPNTTFTASILTTTQMNALPFGVVAYAQTTTTPSSFTTEAVQVTSTTFTAVANRYYRITYYEPQVQTATSGFLVGFIRKTNVSGQQYASSIVQSPTGSALNGYLNVQAVTTFSAGSTTVVGTLASGSGTSVANRNANYPAWILVEDIGPA